MRKAALFLPAFALAACGDDGGSNPGIDAPPPMVTTVSCTGITPSATVATTGLTAFNPPNTTITVGQVVLFDMPLEHDAKSDDNLWLANFNTQTCVKFDSVGTFRFHCEPHLFRGMIVVNPAP